MIKVRVNHVMYRNMIGFKSLIVSVIDSSLQQKEITISGMLPEVEVGDIISIEGKWVDKELEQEFRVDKHIINKEIEDRGMISLLVRNVEGVGIHTAERIMDIYNGSMDKILESPELLKNIGLSEININKILEVIEFNKELDIVTSYLSNFGVSKKESHLIYKKLGSTTIKLIKENPYNLEVSDYINFDAADRIAHSNNMDVLSIDRIKRAVIDLLRYNSISKGDIFTYKKDIKAGILNILLKSSVYSQSINVECIDSIIDKAILESIKEGRIVVKENNKKEICIYIRKHYIQENAIIENIRILSKKDGISNNSIKIIEEILEFEDRENIKFTEEQILSILVALTKKVSIINGGPGTGKTQVIKAIVEVGKRIEEDIKIDLTAPTGKAAKRMAEVIGMDAQTIHRLLGINVLDVNFKEVDSDLLIIDEFSMIDLNMMSHLLNLIEDSTNLVIVGDYNQLPSVGAGSILKDLINSKKVETTTLKEVFRQKEGSKIIDNADQILRGKTDLYFDSTANGESYFLEIEEKRAIDMIIRSINNLIKNRGYNLNDIQVLTFKNEGIIGVREINKRIQEEFNKEKRGIYTENEIIKVNDRVMQTVNNYDLEIFNGDTGIVKKAEISIEGIREIIVDYDGKLVSYNNKNYKELSLSYTMTVHKSQGSEFKVVIMPITKDSNKMANKNLLYTGMTRAKEMMIFVGDKISLKNGILNNIGRRNSMILEKLREENNKETEEINNIENNTENSTEEKEEINRSWKWDFDVDYIKADIEMKSCFLESTSKILLKKAGENGIKYPSLKSDKEIKRLEKIEIIKEEIIEYRKLKDEVEKLRKLINYIELNGNKGEYHTTKTGKAYLKGLSVPYQGNTLLEATGEDYRVITPNAMDLYVFEILEGQESQLQKIINNESVENYFFSGNTIYIKRRKEMRKEEGKWVQINKKEEEEYKKIIEKLVVKNRLESKVEIKGENKELIEENILAEEAF